MHHARPGRLITRRMARVRKLLLLNPKMARPKRFELLTPRFVVWFLGVPQHSAACLKRYKALILNALASLFIDKNSAACLKIAYQALTEISREKIVRRPQERNNARPHIETSSRCPHLSGWA